MSRIALALALASCADPLAEPASFNPGQLQRVDGLLLARAALVAGGSTTVHLYGAAPGETVTLLRGAAVGAGPCPAVLGGVCVSLTNPKVVRAETADADGHVAWTLPVPNLVGRSLPLQAVIPRGVGGVSSIVSPTLGGIVIGGGTWYADADGDGHGDPATGVVQAGPPAGFVGDDEDCDDSDAAVHPSAPEVLGNGVDDDCDGDSVPTFGCAGVPVPGAYATLQDAVNAMQDVGGTICLQAGTFADVVIDANEDLEIVGVSSEHTTLAGVADIKGHPDRLVTLRGMTVTEGVLVRMGTFELQHLVVRTDRSATTSGISVSSRDAGGGAVSVRVDGCDISSSGTAVGIAQSFGFGSPLEVTVENSFLHGEVGGVGAFTSQTSLFDTVVTVIGNTMVGPGLSVGLQTTVTSSGTIELTYADNAITGYATGVSIGNGTRVTAAGHNAYWGNGAAFGGVAVLGPSDRLVDCLFDGNAPPAPTLGSQCIDTGSGTGSATDFWGLPRVRADIGAVEF